MLTPVSCRRRVALGYITVFRLNDWLTVQRIDEFIWRMFNSDYLSTVFAGKFQPG